ncbi:ATP-binding protein [Actinoplanes couchii]|uniref:ATPase n=1 Tax=Actinoplanes couchii TaxID=403638 RepID=A0ABQ3XI15_9ACTN|nr:tetratricopeptide repeat protein [Actinoplanes couchii]MDR6324595.1 tetratricopeptide (TPR) repeat protein [Actinoplanes couchii]GID58147.1 ATPase [Actinoplanes couchii]
MTGPGSAKRELRDRFAELYEAAGKPLYATVARHTRFNLEEAGTPAANIDKQRISSWLSAANPMTPDTFAKLEAFVAALGELAGKRRATVPTWSQQDWRSCWERARRRQRTRPAEHRADGPRARWALPPDTLAFTGRTEEIDQLVASATGGVVSIHAVDGMPGVGKTALAVHAAHRFADRFPGGRIFLDLHAHTPGQTPTDPADALATLLTADGVDPRYVPESLDGRAALWRDRSAAKRILLVIDNAASSEQINPLLPGNPECAVLVTSRRRLGDLPGRTRHVTLGLLPPRQARAMFLSQAPRAATEPVEEVDEVVALAGRLPLAISLLAKVYTAHRVWTLADLRTEIRARLLTLTAEHATVAAAFDVSYDTLPTDRQEFLLHLALHPGTDVDPFAAAVLTGRDLDEAVAQLDALHRENLLIEVGYRRYGVHDLIRSYVETRSGDLPERTRQDALNRLLDFYQHTSGIVSRHLLPYIQSSPADITPDWAGPELTSSTSALAWARTERANLLAALAGARTGDPARFIGFAASLAGLLRMDGPWTETLATYEAAAAAAQSRDDRWAYAYALLCLGDTNRLRSDYDSADANLAQALDLYRDLGSRLGEGNTLLQLGMVRYCVGDHPAAVTLLEQALERYVELGDRRGEANALMNLGVVRYMGSDLSGAVDLLNRSLGPSRELNDLPTTSSVLMVLGYVYRIRGEYAAAEAALTEGLAQSRELGDRWRESNTLSYLGDVLHRIGDRAGAAEALALSVERSREVGSRLGLATGLVFLGTLLRENGDPTTAITTLTEAIELVRELGIRGGEVEALNALGAAYRDLGDLESAADHHQRALALAQEIDSTVDEAHSYAGMGRTELAANRRHLAVEHLRTALALLTKVGAGEATEVAEELGRIETLPDEPGDRRQK